MANFFSLPRELRDEIYITHFSTIRLTSGKYLTHGGDCTVIPLPNSLALIRVNRQIHSETVPLWLAQVLFNFASPTALLDKLYALPRDTLRCIRHVRVGHLPIQVKSSNQPEEHWCTTSLMWILKLLPALDLATLTVLAAPYSSWILDCYSNTYPLIEALLEQGYGWRELRVLVPANLMHVGVMYRRSLGSSPLPRPPPGKGWDTILRKRDGETSGAGVSAYRPSQGDPLESVFNVHLRVPFNAATSLEEARMDAELLRATNTPSGVLVVAKRGRGACIVQPEGVILNPLHRQRREKDTTWLRLIAKLGRGPGTVRLQEKMLKLLHIRPRSELQWRNQGHDHYACLFERFKFRLGRGLHPTLHDPYAYVDDIQLPPGSSGQPCSIYYM